MGTEDCVSKGAWRKLMLACVVALGLVSLVGSGGAEGCFGPCPGDFDNLPPYQTVEPGFAVVQVGGSATFTVLASAIENPSYQWSRGSMNGPSAAIPGATGATYTLAGANLSDDGATFAVTVRGSVNGVPFDVESWNSGQLAVSSMPPVVFHDSEFLPADWSVDSFALPPANGPIHSEQQVASGGNPGPYRSTTIAMPAGPSRLDVFDTLTSAVYDPTSQGPLYIVEFTQDCLTLPGTMGAGPTLLLEQNGRRYIGSGQTTCGVGAWSSAWRPIPSYFNERHFFWVDGPACSAGETLPRLQRQRATNSLRVRQQQPGADYGFAGGSGGFGIDNWKVSAWRR